MKYTKLTFDYGKFSFHETSGMNGYTKNSVYSSLGAHHMYTDTDKLEAGIKKFKKDLLKYYNNIVTTIEKL
jgi:hypothetical protein